MGQIGKFIDAVCDTHPHLMRAVMEKPLAPLQEFIAFDESGQQCGCLIGTMAIAAGFVGCKSEFRRPIQRGGRLLYGSVSSEACCEALGTELGEPDVDLFQIGVAVYNVSKRLAKMLWSERHCTLNTDRGEQSDARTVHLIRQRIARQLAIRESALGVDHPALPNEPVERRDAHSPWMREPGRAGA